MLETGHDASVPQSSRHFAQRTCLHIAPVSKAGKRTPANSYSLRRLAKTALLCRSRSASLTILSATRIIDADVIDQWRIPNPFGDLRLSKRTRLDKGGGFADQRPPGVEHAGVNAPHVAPTSRLADDGHRARPRELCAGVRSRGRRGRVAVCAIRISIKVWSNGDVARQQVCCVVSGRGLEVLSVPSAVLTTTPFINGPGPLQCVHRHRADSVAKRRSS